MRPRILAHRHNHGRVRDRLACPRGFENNSPPVELLVNGSTRQLADDIADPALPLLHAS